jgi:F-type H+-transporting ATPase subunit gamma
MPSLKAIRSRISTVKSMQKITRAMKLVAAARLRRAQDSIVAARPYANALADAVAELVLRTGEAAHPLLERRDPARLTIVPITSDRGLAGGFNANVFRAVGRLMAEKKDAREVVLEVVGRKGRDHFRRRRLTAKHELPAATSERAGELAREVAHIVSQAFLDGQTDAVYLVYNEFKSAAQQRVVAEPLLPIATASLAAPASAAGAAIDFLYEPSRRHLLDAILPLYVEWQIMRALLESVASEFGARMTAMENASNNAKEMIATYTLQYNRARQAAITKELMEIVGGAEALKG